MRDEMGGTYSTHRRNDHAYSILDGKPEGKRSLGRQRRTWEDNIKTNLRERGWEGVN
jgi:hypothetical protein